MKNFLILISTIPIVLILIVLFAGKMVKDDFTYETRVVFDVNKDLLWNIINNVDDYKKNKYGIVSLEKKEYQGDTLIKWQENLNFGISKDYEIFLKKDPENLVYKVVNNFTGMTSTLSFYLSEDENKTYLNIKEESYVKNIVYKGLKVLSGKESYINSQIKWIRVGLYNYLITK